MYGLEQKLKAYEKAAPKPRSDGSYEVSMNGALVIIERDGTVSVTPASAKPPRAAFEDACDPPYTIDPNGMRTPKPSCAPSQEPCDPPYSVDAQGNRRVKKECL